MSRRRSKTVIELMGRQLDSLESMLSATSVTKADRDIGKIIPGKSKASRLHSQWRNLRTPSPKSMNTKETIDRWRNRHMERRNEHQGKMKEGSRASTIMYPEKTSMIYRCQKGIPISGKFRKKLLGL